jgi:hypothetical protein
MLVTGKLSEQKMISFGILAKKHASRNDHNISVCLIPVRLCSGELFNVVMVSWTLSLHIDVCLVQNHHVHKSHMGRLSPICPSSWLATMTLQSLAAYLMRLLAERSELVTIVSLLTHCLGVAVLMLMTACGVGLQLH